MNEIKPEPAKIRTEIYLTKENRAFLEPWIKSHAVNDYFDKAREPTIEGMNEGSINKSIEIIKELIRQYEKQFKGNLNTIRKVYFDRLKELLLYENYKRISQSAFDSIIKHSQKEIDNELKRIEKIKEQERIATEKAERIRKRDVLQKKEEEEARKKEIEALNTELSDLKKELADIGGEFEPGRDDHAGRHAWFTSSIERAELLPKIKEVKAKLKEYGVENE